MTKSTNLFKVSLSIMVLTLCFLKSDLTQAQGPNSPEAASFEPLDVTDVVNLVTGDFTYTIPTIEVPGPNGGYPLTLAYHAGISMDQEASWVGLGWSLNPGAINRNVNGYPDDWDNVKSYEYYWNKGGVLRQHSVDVTIPIYGITVGLGASWGSLRGFSGSVGVGVAGFNVSMDSNGGGSLGYGSKSTGIGANVAWSGSGEWSVGVGYSTGGTVGGSLGVSYSSSGKVSGSASVTTQKAVGNGYSANASLGITTNGAVTYGTGMSLKTFDLSESSLFRTTSVGTGGSAFSTVQTKNDMTTKHSGYTIPLILISYKYEKVKWWVDKLKSPGITGGLYADTDILNIPQDAIDFCESTYGRCDDDRYDYENNYNPTACDCIRAEGVGYGYTGTQANPDYAFLDINEINYNGDSERFSILNRNPALLNFDGYNVSGQGLAGSMSPKILKNLSLVNVNHDFEEADLSYYRNDNGTGSIKANFYFDNQLSGGAIVNKVTFNDVSNPTSFDDYIVEPTTAVSGTKRSGNFVEYFTYNNLPANVQLPNDFVKPDHVDDNSVVGFRVTSTDGITYYYMLPVYSIMEKMRSFNYQDEDGEIYSERTNSPYATHWLLTAITGADYVDQNTDGIVNEGDLGYWVDFEYGKWSDGYTWRSPSKSDEYRQVEGTKMYSWGLKELYYLDRISTRTHSALFVKSVRQDNMGIPQVFTYKSKEIYATMPAQKQLKLDKIVLVQNSKIGIFNKINAYNLISSPHEQGSFIEPKIGKTYNYILNGQNNVLDIEDDYVKNIESNALRVVDFSYSYELAQNAPNSFEGGKLTLKNLLFRGKKGVSLIPPYKFTYNNNPNWEFENTNYWGYNSRNAAAWSLSEVMTPVGTIMEVELESDVYWNYESNTRYDFKSVSHSPSTYTLQVNVDVGNYDLKAGDVLNMSYNDVEFDCFDNVMITSTYDGQVELVSSTDAAVDFSTNFKIKLLNPELYGQTRAQINGDCPENPDYNGGGASFTNINGASFKHKSHAGVRVAALNVKDNSNTYKTTYEYGFGSVPYEVFYNTQGIANQSLLRSPNVLYDKVTLRNLDINGNPINDVKQVYEFIIDGDIVDNKNINLSSNASSTNITSSFNGNATRNSSYDYQDYKNAIGNLKGVSVYQGSTLLSKSINNYTFLDESSGFVNTESTQMYKAVNPKPGNTSYINLNRLISTSYTNYPLVLESSETISGGFKNTTYFDKRDINTGSVLESRFFGSDGKEYKQEIIPAYTIGAYSDMGSKEDDFENHNMLTQTAMEKSSIKENNVWALTGAGISTWKPWTNGIWRIHKTFTWNGQTDVNGYYQNYIGDYDNFNWAVNVNQAETTNWKKMSEVTKYDNFSMPIEAIDINLNRVATKMGYNNTKVIATGNAGYDELFYSGAEDLLGVNFGGEVGVGTGTVTSVEKHTGTNSLQINTGQTGFVVSVTKGKSSAYKVSVWVRKDGKDLARLKVGNEPVVFPRDSETVDADDWSLVSFYFDVTGTQNVHLTSSGGVIYADDFRLHPVTSSITSYVYNEWDELSYVLGRNNLGVHYLYDEAGRLKETQVEAVNFNGDPKSGGFKKSSSHQYNYKY